MTPLRVHRAPRVDAFLDNDLYHAAAASRRRRRHVRLRGHQHARAEHRCGVRARSAAVARRAEHDRHRSRSSPSATRCGSGDDDGEPLFDAGSTSSWAARRSRASSEPQQPQLSLYNVAAGRNDSRAELRSRERLVSLADNPLIAPSAQESNTGACARICSIRRRSCARCARASRRPLAQRPQRGWRSPSAAPAPHAALTRHRHHHRLVAGRAVRPQSQAGVSLRSSCEARSSNEVLKEHAEAPLPRARWCSRCRSPVKTFRRSPRSITCCCAAASGRRAAVRAHRRGRHADGSGRGPGCTREGAVAGRIFSEQRRLSAFGGGDRQRERDPRDAVRSLSCCLRALAARACQPPAGSCSTADGACWYERARRLPSTTTPAGIVAEGAQQSEVGAADRARAGA